jgi:hypothetical protein
LYAHRQDCKGRHETYNAYRRFPRIGSADRLRFPEQEQFARSHGAVKRNRIDWNDSFIFFFVFSVFVVFVIGSSGGFTCQLALRGHVGGTRLQWSAEYQ